MLLFVLILKNSLCKAEPQLKVKDSENADIYKMMVLWFLSLGDPGFYPAGVWSLLFVIVWFILVYAWVYMCSKRVCEEIIMLAGKERRR